MFLPIGNCCPGVMYSPHGSETRRASSLTSGQTNTLHGKLETDNARPIGLGNYSGLSHPLLCLICARGSCCLSREGEALPDVEIQEMLEKGAIQESQMKGRGFISNVFLVPKKDGGQRPVINLKKLNEYVHTEHFHMKGIPLLKDLLRKGDWIAKMDLMDASWFRYTERTEISSISFAGTNDTSSTAHHLAWHVHVHVHVPCATWVFTKVLKPVAAQLGVRMIVYIDDMLIIA